MPASAAAGLTSPPGFNIPLVGLTGGVGAGKSAAADVFTTLGIPVIDTDQLARRLTASGGRAVASIRDRFGPDAIAADGAADRAYLRKHVFAQGDSVARTALEDILHPMIRDDVETALQDHVVVPPGTPYVVLAVPLFFERLTYRHLVQRVLVIDCTVSAQIGRVRQRPGLTEALAEQIVNAQVPRRVRLQMADDVLVNNRTMDVLVAGVKTLHQTYLEALGDASPHARAAAPVCALAGLGSECAISRNVAETPGTLPRP